MWGSNGEDQRTGTTVMCFTGTTATRRAGLPNGEPDTVSIVRLSALSKT